MPRNPPSARRSLVIGGSFWLLPLPLCPVPALPARPVPLPLRQRPPSVQRHNAPCPRFRSPSKRDPMSFALGLLGICFLRCRVLRQLRHCDKFRLGRIVWACRIQRGRAAPFDFFKRLPCIKPHGGHTSQRASFRPAQNLAPSRRAVAVQASRAAPIGPMRPVPLGFRAMYWGQAAQHRAS